MKPKFVKIFLTVLFLGSSMQLLAQEENDTLSANENYLDNSFALCRIPLEVYTLEEQEKLKKNQGHYLIILPPVFETRKDTIQFSIQPFYEKTAPLAENILVNCRYDYIESYAKPRILDMMSDMICISADPKDCVTIDFERIPPVTKPFKRYINKSDYENGKIDSLIIFVVDYHYILKPAQVIKTSTFNPSDYDKLNSIKIHYLAGHSWSGMKEIYCPLHYKEPSSYKEAIQLALRDKGYETRIDGVFDEVAIKALIDYQTKNNLPVGKPDKTTFYKLNGRKYLETKPKVHDAYQYLDSPRFDY